MSFRRGALVSAVLLSLGVLTACGDDSEQPTGGSGAGGAAGGATSQGGAGGHDTQAADVTSIDAPDETTVVVQLEGDFTTAPVTPSAYSLTSLHGDLTVGDVV